MTELLFLIEADPAGGYTARALGGDVFLEADTLDALHEQIRDFVYIDAHEVETPESISMEVIR